MKNTVLTVVVMLVLHGCSKRDLSRDDASRMLKQRFPPRTEWKLAEPIFAKGISEDLWSDQVMPGTHGMFLSVTPRGQRFIDSVVQTPNDAAPVAVLRQPIAPTIEVGGITDAGSSQNEKRVEFNWSFTGQPQEIEELLRWSIADTTSPPWPGTATFRLYDDGWRLQEVEGVAYQAGSDRSFQISRSAPFPTIPDVVEANLRKAISAFKTAIAAPGRRVTFCNSAQDCVQKLPDFTPTAGIQFNLGIPMSGDHMYAEAWREGGDRKYSYNEAANRIEVFACNGICTR